MECEDCNGKGTIECDVCDGGNEIDVSEELCRHCQDGEVECITCQGTGQIDW